MATEACKTGKVKIGEKNVKASTLVSGGEHVHVKKNGFNLEFNVVKLIEKRVSATLAAPCYEDITPEEEMNKYKDWFIGKASSEQRLRGAGRPTKRERRDLDDYKESFYDEFD